MEPNLHQNQNQMIYQPNRLSTSTTTTTTTTTIKRRRKPNLPPIGYKNLGNTCYLNSVLQCLTFTPPLSQLSLSSLHSSNCSLSSTSSCAFCLLERRISRSLTLETSSLDAPYKIHNNLKLFSDQFRYNRQEDAHEFLRYVIDACHNACLRENKKKRITGLKVKDESSLVKEIFGGELRSQVKCCSCNGESNKVDEIMDISLDLFQIDSVNDALKKFFQVEVLSGTNKYSCDNCKKLVVAKKQMAVLKAPNVLVIQLKRFEGIHGGKIDRMIAFEECLVLSNYMCKETQDPHPEYNLFGTIVHSGYSPDSGHYYAYIKDALGRWYCCNDSFVSLSTLQEVLSEKVYILFFTRTNPKPRPTKSLSAANGVKSPHCNGHEAQNPKSAAPLSMGKRPFDKVIPQIPKNGKIPLTPKLKFGNFSKENRGNGNGNGNRNGNVNGISNGHAKDHIGLKKLNDEENIMKERTSLTNQNGATANGFGDTMDSESKQSLLLLSGNGKTLGTSVEPLKTENSGATANGFGETVDSESKQSLLLPNGDGKTLGITVKLVKTENFMDGGSDHIVENGRTSGSVLTSREDSTVSGSKRKGSDGEYNFSPPSDGNQLEAEKTKEVIEKDASSYLRSCGWYDDVYNFMHARKKLCAQIGGSTTDNVDRKKFLIGESRPKFISQVPAALKAHLIKALSQAIK